MRASNEEILCHGDFVGVAHVLSGFSRDFQEMGKPFNEGLIQLSIEITRPLAAIRQSSDLAAGRIPRSGDTLEVVSSICNNLPSVPGALYEMWRPGTIRTGHNCSDSGRIGVEPPTGQPLTHAEVVTIFSEKGYVFSIQLQGHKVPFSSFMWQIERLDWAVETLRHGPSTRPRPDNA